MNLAQLWAQFFTLGSTVIFVYGLSKIPFVRTLWHRNISDPFAHWMAHQVGTQVAPVHHRIDSLYVRLNELADALDYEFRSNGGNSLRDRVDAILVQTPNGDRYDLAPRNP